MEALEVLEAWFADSGPAVLGYSGGVDSTLLAVVGTRVLGPGRFRAVIGRSASYPESQWRDALALAAAHGVAVFEVDTEELANPSYRANAPNRCYYCKQELWSTLARLARAWGIGTVIDGTHAEDLLDHRPGAQAAKEAGVRSPLVELGWTKAMVRSAAAGLGIANAAAPAAPCLSSRIRYGLEVTAARLAQVEQAEAWLRSLGVAGDLRVRHHGDRAVIEADPAMFPVLEANWPTVVERLGGLGFPVVERDPRGYRRGSLLPLAG